MDGDAWGDLGARAEAARTHLGNAVDLFAMGGLDLPGLDGYRNRMAVLYALHCGLAASEKAIRLLRDLLGEMDPASPEDRARLAAFLPSIVFVPLYGRPAVLSAVILGDLVALRRLRDATAIAPDLFDPGAAAPTVDAARRLSEEILRPLRDLAEAMRLAHSLSPPPASSDRSSGTDRSHGTLEDAHAGPPMFDRDNFLKRIYPASERAAFDPNWTGHSTVPERQPSDKKDATSAPKGDPEPDTERRGHGTL